MHVLDGIDRDSDFADFACGERVVRVQADLRGKIEGYGQARSAVGQQVLVTFVGFFGVAHAGVLAHRPEASAIHGWLDTTGEGILARVSDIRFRILIFEVSGRIKRMNRNVRGSLRVLFWLGGL